MNDPDIMKTEFSEDFVQGMRNRMEISYHKYGPICEAYPDVIDAFTSAIQRMREYTKTGNTEYLIDAANFMMIEFMLPRHPQAHFTPTDDSGSPGRVNLDTGRPDKRDNAILKEEHERSK